ncbi:hypothetical protein [Pedobacter psychrophilus]|nr:hypothetical protein [Pedobacter psychrophilus]
MRLIKKEKALLNGFIDRGAKTIKEQGIVRTFKHSKVVQTLTGLRYCIILNTETGERLLLERNGNYNKFYNVPKTSILLDLLG